MKYVPFYILFIFNLIFIWANACSIRDITDSGMPWNAEVLD